MPVDEDELEEDEKMDMISDLDSNGNRVGFVGFRTLGRLRGHSAKLSKSNSSRSSKISMTSMQSYFGVQVIDDFQSCEDEEVYIECNPSNYDSLSVSESYSNLTHIQRIHHMGTFLSKITNVPAVANQNPNKITRSSD